jgi:SAM-dependent methyltransferase
MAAYTEAVASGLYAKQTGLTGKYDNVRRYWEDETTRRFLRSHIYRLVERCRSRMKRLRVMDLGCGSADGFELLAGIRDREANLHDVEVALMSPQMLGQYKGVDLNESLLDQARGIYGSSPKLAFELGDFTKGLPIKDGEKPYDLYFTSFGTCSHHNTDETLIALLAEMAERAVDNCIIVCDWVGRYSYEWQTLWTNDLSENSNLDYVVSYIYEKEEREARRDELQHLTLRLVCRQEAETIVAEASRRAGVEIKPLEFFDRSILTGRHMDTREYNPNSPPIRLAVNSLHERNMRTDLAAMVFDYVPKPGFDFLNDYFERLQACWNILVTETQDLMETYDEERKDFTKTLAPIPASYPPALREMIDRMRRVVAGVGWLGIGLPRENIIEPQLGYALRYLVTNLQQGLGCAHGLVGIFEVNKNGNRR